MNKYLVAAAAVMSLSGAASAQVAFQFGTIDLEYFDVNHGLDVYTFSGGGRADYDIGNLGLQLDGTAFAITNFNSSYTNLSVGAHVYKQLENGAKFGAYFGIKSFDGPIIPQLIVYKFGLEGMMRFGPLDVDAYLGGSIANGYFFWMVDVDVYYSLTDRLELSLGMAQIIDEERVSTDYSIGLMYDIPNAPLSIGLEYLPDDLSSMVVVNASYAFGAPTNERLFGKRVRNAIYFRP